VSESWELTRAEFAADVRAGKRDFNCPGIDGRTGAYLARMLGYAERDGNNVDLARATFDKAVLQHHCADVLIAFSDGKPVPKHVLREYADYFKPEFQEELFGQLELLEAQLAPPPWTYANAEAQQAYDQGVQEACDAIRSQK
jgi:hypothetical protein